MAKKAKDMAKKAKKAKDTANYVEKSTDTITLRVYEQNKKADYWSGSLVIADVFAVKIIIREYKDDYYICWPSYQVKKGEYNDLCFPITKEFREEIMKLLASVMDELEG